MLFSCRNRSQQAQDPTRSSSCRLGFLPGGQQGKQPERGLGLPPTHHTPKVRCSNGWMDRQIN